MASNAVSQQHFQQALQHFKIVASSNIYINITMSKPISTQLLVIRLVISLSRMLVISVLTPALDKFYPIYSFKLDFEVGNINGDPYIYIPTTRCIINA